MAQGIRLSNFWDYVDKKEPDKCWPWLKTANTAGYGYYSNHKLAHRVSYEMHYGSIPERHVIHHKCGNKLCVNPSHLELNRDCEHKSNTYKSHCKHGHEYNDENTYYYHNSNRRACRACGRRYTKERKARIEG